MIGLKDIERLGWLKPYIQEKNSKELVDKMIKESFDVENIDEFSDDVREAIAKADQFMLKNNPDYVDEFVGRL